MRSVRNSETPWAPYAAMFSRDGSRLTTGGGCCYGHGGIILVDLDRWQSRSLDWRTVPWVDPEQIHSLTSFPSSVPTVSSFCFSDDDRVLAASMWSHCGCPPAMLFDVDGTELHPRQVFGYDGVDLATTSEDRKWPFAGFASPTGVLLHEGRIMTRLHGGDPEGTGVLPLGQLPAGREIPASGSLAAHPVEPWIAVGIKRRGFEDPRGVIAILAIE